MRSDPYILVECDGDDCSASIDVEAPFPYTHRTTDSEEDRAVERAGWTVKDGKDLCEGCAPEGEDD
jgi:hypothetical protein